MLISLMLEVALGVEVCEAQYMGCTHTSIQAAVDAATSTDVIYVRAGTYEESVSVARGAPVIHALGPVTWRAPNSASALSMGAGSSLRLEVDPSARFTLQGSRGGQPVVVMDGATLSVQHARIEPAPGLSTWGGAIDAVASTLSLDQVEIDGGDLGVDAPTGSAPALIRLDGGINSSRGLSSTSLLTVALRNAPAVGILGEGDVQVALDGVVFERLTSSTRGGAAVSLVGVGASLTSTRGRYEDLAVSAPLLPSDCGLATRGCGGAIYVRGAAASLSLAQDHFVRVSADRDGGAIFFDGKSASLDAVEVLSSSADLSGAASLSVSDQLAIRGSLFCDNSSGGPTTSLHAGLAATSVVVDHSTWLSNYSSGGVSGLFLETRGTGAVAVKHLDLVNNESGSQAGVMEVSGSASVERSLFYANAAPTLAATLAGRDNAWYQQGEPAPSSFVLSQGSSPKLRWSAPIPAGDCRAAMGLAPYADSPLVRSDGTPTLGAFEPADDADGDGFVTDRISGGRDCDDADPAINPDAQEVCDGVDNDCDGLTDEGQALGSEQLWVDGDGDGVGAGSALNLCPGPGLVRLGGDCADDDANTYPGALEFCDEVDNDCDGVIDDAAEDAGPRWADGDGDGFGAGPSQRGCPGVGWALEGGDCDDADREISPSGTEVCDGQDNDCDGRVDVDAVDAPAFRVDVDGDGYGGDGVSFACDMPEGHVPFTDEVDCQDLNPAISPGAEELCDGLDNDCDGEVDVDAVDAPPWFEDLDGDGYGGTDGAAQLSCWQPPGFRDSADDCDDARADVHPGALELCDGLDNDCDGEVDVDAVELPAWYPDADGDGYGASGAEPVYACEAPGGVGVKSGDCDDTDPAIHPEAQDLDGVDRNCDGEVVSTWVGGTGGCSTGGLAPSWLALLLLLTGARRRQRVIGR